MGEDSYETERKHRYTVGVSAFQRSGTARSASIAVKEVDAAYSENGYDVKTILSCAKEGGQRRIIALVSLSSSIGRSFERLLFSEGRGCARREDPLIAPTAAFDCGALLERVLVRRGPSLSHFHHTCVWSRKDPRPNNGT